MEPRALSIVINVQLYTWADLSRVDTNAHKLQPSFSESVIVDGHGCHTAQHFGVKAKKTKTILTLCWLP